MRKFKLKPYPEKIGSVIQETPWDVLVAWKAHAPYCNRYLVKGEAQPYLDTLLALKRAVRRNGQLGYYVTGGYLFGYVGESFDPVWKLIPDTAPIHPESFSFDPIMGLSAALAAR